MILEAGGGLAYHFNTTILEIWAWRPGDQFLTILKRKSWKETLNLGGREQWPAHGGREQWPTIGFDMLTAVEKR